MIETQDASKIVKRPLIITIICIVLFISYLFGFFSLLIPDARNAVTQQYGASVIAFTVLSGIVGLVAIIGYWKMRKWGVYLYCASIVINIMGGLVLKFQTSLYAYLMAAVIIGIGLAYFRRMT